MDDFFEPAPFFWIEEGRVGQASTPRAKKKIKRKKEYVSWGSRELIEFLESIGKDTAKALSQYDVTNIIYQYVKDMKLVHPSNKRRISCDEKLLTLFEKKTMFRNKIYEFLTSHFAENHEDSDNDHFGSSDENGENGFSVSKKQKTSSSVKVSQPRKKVPQVSKSCLAAINSDNIKLLYLRKSLVQELLKNTETVESKVVGSFVRVKSDPHDYFQKNSHQLQLVTGVMEIAPVGVAGSSTLLQISGITDKISISELSDENFSEGEIEDLRMRVKDGLLKQPTVGELEQKAAVLHQDITKHWLARECVLVKNLKDRANEKGWRHRVREHDDRLKLLQSPEEQSRLLNETPKVMAEEVKPESISDTASDDSPKAGDWDWEPFDFLPTNGDMTKPEVSNKQDGQATEATAVISTRNNGDAHPYCLQERNQPGIEPLAAVNDRYAQSLKVEEKEASKAETIEVQSNGYPLAAVNNRYAQSLKAEKNEAPKAEIIKVESNGYTDTSNANHVAIRNKEMKQESNGHLLHQSPKESKKTPVVIDLSDDDEEPEVTNVRTQIPRPREIASVRTQILAPHVEQLVWHYMDPQRRIQGPFSLLSLKRWSDAKYFGPDFRVWAIGQKPEQAVLLNQLLQHIFPN